MKKTTGRGVAATTFDGYLAALDAPKRAALEKLRAQVHAAAPGCEECISYGLPAMKHAGRMLVFLGAGVNHCAFYPGGIVADFAAELADYETSKGTIRFTPEHPIPATLVRRIVKACVARNAARGEARTDSAKSKAAARTPAKKSTKPPARTKQRTVARRG